MHVTRRLMMFGFAAGAAGAGSAEAAQRSSSSMPTDTDRQTVDVLKDIAGQLRSQIDPPILTTIRDAQHSFLRANQRYPEYIEVGVGVWDQLYDWHVHTGQQLQIARLTDGRYGMATLMSIMVLHVGAQPGYVGPGSANL